MENFTITDSAISEIVPLMGAYRVIILFDKYRCGFPLLLCRRGGRPVEWAMLKPDSRQRQPTVVTKNK
jgi:hypothetical protein